MDNKKKRIDPRILRTRQLLKDALVELLQEMDIEKITVNRLAERATINRVTFYLHYKDIQDMVEKMADEMVQEISVVMSQTYSTDVEASSDQDWSLMASFLEYISENAKFYKVLLTSKSVPVFRDSLLKLLKDKIVSRVESKGSQSVIRKAGIQDDILIWYDSSALIGTIVAWLKNDMPYTPSFMAKQFYLLHNRKVNVDFG
ncbi:TetR/AcrR family transcriptional regulator [Oceanobacillus massiliensis]|uniref:TetR/AcrR family transcriptional regulator n=1 Tax=Oceanobacillus massiliensis TaxID=1465765 RepID=UPI00028981C3|nr:TetR/AcrR family transcriptional regulator [Oceanobacillus massiliensis]